MKIMICGSMTFSKEMLAAKEKLEKQGHIVKLPCDIDTHLENSKLIDDLETDFEYCTKHNIMKTCMDTLTKSDAILVMNHRKNSINGYIGTACLMEIGLAYYLGKKIFLLNPTPKPSEARWAHEIRIIGPTIINGDFAKVS
ncbi:MAG: hypothetical protein NTW67_04335 [Candidatus Woesearchaeota archaeon]|nr:hypothetical protein [Candidatus Woesearchaeota archaeon]